MTFALCLAHRNRPATFSSQATNRIWITTNGRPLDDLVERGEEVIITRHRQPAAKLVPAQSRVDRALARAAAERIRARAAALKCKITLDEIKAYRDEGR